MIGPIGRRCCWLILADMIDLRLTILDLRFVFRLIVNRQSKIVSGRRKYDTKDWFNGGDGVVVAAGVY
jgi:hypothetical protein